MDELAVELGIDPVELRLRNYAEEDQNDGKPFSSKELRECYRQAAERFGWARRDPEPAVDAAGLDADRLGHGRRRLGGDAAEGGGLGAVLTVDGKLTVSSATEDIGTGTYTIMTQIAAELLGLPIEDVTFKLGDSSLPEAPGRGRLVHGRLGRLGGQGRLRGGPEDAVRARPEGRRARRSPRRRSTTSTFADGPDPPARTTRRGPSPSPRRCGRARSTSSRRRRPPDPPKQDEYSRHTHSAIFAEVEVDEDFGTVRVTRVVTAVAGGRILNPKTARSQVMGGDRLGHRDGPARGERARPPVRPVHDPQPRRLPRPGQRRRRTTSR